MRLGLTDGTTTEVNSPEVKDGMEIITGSNRPQQSGAARLPQPGGPRMF